MPAQRFILALAITAGAPIQSSAEVTQQPASAPSKASLSGPRVHQLLVEQVTGEFTDTSIWTCKKRGDADDALRGLTDLALHSPEHLEVA